MGVGGALLNCRGSSSGFSGVADSSVIGTDTIGVQGSEPARVPMENPQDKSTMRALGEFFGHVIKGVKTDPSKAAPAATRTRVEEETRQTPAGRVVLRRTIIEEIVLPPQNPEGDASRPIPPAAD